MAGYLTNTLIKFARRDVDDQYNVADYTSINFNDVKTYINALPDDMFDWRQVENDDKWERLANEFYENPDYWDILLIINNRNPLTGLPFSFDTISDLSEDKVIEYQNDVYGKTLPDAEHQLMYQAWEDIKIEENENIRVIKIIRPSQMSKFLQDGYDQGVF